MKEALHNYHTMVELETWFSRYFEIQLLEFYDEMEKAFKGDMRKRVARTCFKSISRVARTSIIMNYARSALKVIISWVTRAVARTSLLRMLCGCHA